MPVLPEFKTQCQLETSKLFGDIYFVANYREQEWLN